MNEPSELTQALARPADWKSAEVIDSGKRETQDGILTFGLRWLDWHRTHPGRRSWGGLRLFLPKGAGSTTAHRMRALAPSVQVELFELDEDNWRATRLDPADSGNLDTWLTPHRETQRALDEAGAAIRAVRELAPESIDAVVPPGTSDVALRFRGLEFARWRSGRLEFGIEEDSR